MGNKSYAQSEIGNEGVFPISYLQKFSDPLNFGLNDIGTSSHNPHVSCLPHSPKLRIQHKSSHNNLALHIVVIEPLNSGCHTNLGRSPY